MLRKDYLVRMIEEMTEIIGKVFDLKQQKKWIEALWELDELYKKQFRLNSRLIGSLGAKDIVELMRTGGTVEADKLQSLARLVKEEGEIYSQTGQSDESIFRLMKALHLYLAAGQHGTDRTLWNLDGEVRELLTRLQGYRLPPDTERLLLSYEESEGRYDQAENALYRLFQDGVATIEEGIAFYERLLLIDRERLEQGGLPEQEVREGLQSWMAAAHEEN
ncbi:hypothetical protein KB559_24500 [Paenibacillus sp. Marseille-P2973]|uniref:DUF6483 family protein n=1 Tax=Paenibacillus sp. Marseille-P2973 TaxID=1871032 RepID=UPI001B36A6C2|nr:DUF6483 family protein [Paenibacillus sp. Marseille-P2973]MBQ4901978.1 hypothetical protein [Paenibacillus sp. Marseille-P2973]